MFIKHDLQHIIIIKYKHFSKKYLMIFKFTDNFIFFKKKSINPLQSSKIALHLHPQSSNTGV